ncbi:hypothetical protein DFP72DRAFT_1167168 [Ephemerocybe angulata]|uniref:3'-5' exonuclease n=1 Tax=Ephemerocybe angulata TaxID=980116 RepID=A0A8H6I6F5_9AGAR|nr:hypothetical protein DFP72DRAFT_1167168 [Tulosesus angulatus]
MDSPAQQVPETRFTFEYHVPGPPNQRTISFIPSSHPPQQEGFQGLTGGSAPHGSLVYPASALGASALSARPGHCAPSTGVDTEPKRPPGRPRGTGKRQREAAERAARGIPPPPKRKPGRPRKVPNQESRQQVSVDFGTFTVAGRPAGPSRRATMPTQAPQQPSPGDRNLSGWLRPGAPSSGLANHALTHVSARTNNDQHQSPTASNLGGSRASGSETTPRRHPVSAESMPQHPITESRMPKEDEVGSENELEIDGAGLGDDFDEVGEGEEDSSGSDTNSTESNNGTRPGRRVPHPLPPHIMDPFKIFVKESSVRNSDGLPPLYASRSFWFPSKSTFFTLRNAVVPTPESMYCPDFFLWDPISLCSAGIPCPSCRKPLQRHTHIPRPRRCISFKRSYWVIGYRYRCRECKQTFRSWDQRVLDKLPPDLAAEFPVHFTHRSGIAVDLLDWVRSCFQSGMGSMQVSDTIRTQHVLYFDRLRLQHLDHLVSRTGAAGIGQWRGAMYAICLPFEDRSPSGYHGFAPSGAWLRDVYDAEIERHRDELTQQMALLPLTIGAADHSHKLTKHIARVGGKRPFDGVHMVTNEFSEIRACHLVTTKGHSQTRIALKGIKDSLTLYGLDQPQVFYTDNMADKGLFEEIFPSLTEDVIPVEKYAHLEELDIPDGMTIQPPKKEASAINGAIEVIMDGLANDGLGEVVVGFDCEWNVEVTANGRVQHSGKVAIIQLAYEKQIYTLQITDLVAHCSLPAQLRAFLTNPRILKAGRNVGHDLRLLEQAFNEPTRSFVGALDLATYAKQRCVISSTKSTSLSDLTALILHKRLNKNVPERVSTCWESDSLSGRQITYAARDAFACLRIWQELSKFEIPEAPAPSRRPHPATPLVLFSTDKSRPIATGQISRHSLASSFNGTKLTPSVTVVDIFRVLVPGAKIKANNQKSSLQDCGPVPFTVIVNNGMVRLYSSTSSLVPQFPALSLRPSTPLGHSQTRHSSTTNQPNPPNPPSSSGSTGESPEAPPSGPSGVDPTCTPIGGLVMDTGSPKENESGIPTDEEEVLAGIHQFCADAGSAAEGARVLGKPPIVWLAILRSRVLKDPFHLFNMFYISAKHGLRVAFARALRDAIFLLEQEDVDRITAWGKAQNPPRTFEQLCATIPDWVWQHCRRIIPPAEVLYPRVREVFETYGPLKDATTQVPLFDTNNWKIARNILDLIYHGYLSDPPGIPLYSEKPVETKSGLPVYSCFRGTNRTEGAVHTRLRPHLPSSGASIVHVQACLTDFCTHHNLMNGTYNRTGQRYRGHFHVWVSNRIQERLILLRDVILNPPETDDDRIDGSVFTQTSEVIGVLPIPEDTQAQSGMQPYIDKLDSTRRNHSLARLQGVRKAAIPIHNDAESELYKNLMKEHPAFNNARAEPTWTEAVKVWNRMAEEDPQVFYKLVEHLKSHHVEWKATVNAKATLAQTAEERKRARALLERELAQFAIPPVLERHTQPREPTRGFRESQIASTSSSLTHGVRAGGGSQAPSMSSTATAGVPHSAPANPDLPQCLPPSSSSALPSQQHPSHGAESPPSIAQDARAAKEAIARKRVADEYAEREPVKAARVRTCMKCGDKETCKGRKAREYCKNPCQDCGRCDCPGRNSKRPSVKCENSRRPAFGAGSSGGA